MPRVINFFDGQSSATTPTVEAIASMQTFANDGAYEAEFGTGAAGDIYFNTTSNKIRFHNGSGWVESEAELNNSTTSDPGVSDDNTAGYSILSMWVNTTSDAVFVAADVSTGAAVWVDVSGTGGSAFSDADFEIQDDGDNTKKIKFQASGITTSTTRTITMIDEDLTPVGTSNSQVITAKDYDGGTASDTSRFTLSSDTTANLSGLTRKAGTLFYDTTLGEPVYDTGAALVSMISAGATSFAYVREEQTSGTAGGSATSGSFATRTLNTLTQSDSWASLASNQIDLLAGDYLFLAWAPAHRVDQHKIKIRNIDDSTDAAIGNSSFNSSGGTGNSSSIAFLAGFTSIASTKTFELQHRVTTTKATDGFGVASTYGVVEVFGSVVIFKI